VFSAVSRTALSPTSLHLFPPLISIQAGLLRALLPQKPLFDSVFFPYRRGFLTTCHFKRKPIHWHIAKPQTKKVLLARCCSPSARFEFRVPFLPRFHPDVSVCSFCQGSVRCAGRSPTCDFFFPMKMLVHTPTHSPPFLPFGFFPRFLLPPCRPTQAVWGLVVPPLHLPSQSLPFY